ncbi:MAG: hypothetical protein K0R65_338 [Crocinitomicaceae bacterium]|jgi:hypothetical protein|nr:hypothetical protein [Crocinitomicaceae bacterium]
MKNLTKTLTAFAFMLTAFAATAQSENSYIGKARGFAHDCLNDYQGYRITASVQETAICIVSGSLHQVTFTATPDCQPNVPCPAVAILVATVEFDCDGNPYLLSCGGFPTE